MLGNHLKAIIFVLHVNCILSSDILPLSTNKDNAILLSLQWFVSIIRTKKIILSMEVLFDHVNVAEADPGWREGSSCFLQKVQHRVEKT